MYPQWGELVDGEVQKVHLFGHSLGAQTIRMLAQLLAHGTDGAPTPEDPTSHPLFAGGHGDWVHSITTLAGTNQGTFVADGLAKGGGGGDLVKDLVFSVFSATGAFGNGTTTVYDPMLDQWGIAPKRASESLKDYLDRVFHTNVFQPGFQDTGIYSMSTWGAAGENDWVTTLPNVYYFSFSLQDSFAGKDALLRTVQLPRVLTMLASMVPVSTFLGSRFGPDHGFPEAWQKNDGAVNTVSQPSDGHGELVEGVAHAKPGRWHHVGQIDKTDHDSAVGATVGNGIFDVYTAHFKLLASLAKGESTNQQVRLFSTDDATDEGYLVPEDIVRELGEAIERVAASSPDEEEAQTRQHSLRIRHVAPNEKPLEVAGVVVVPPNEKPLDAAGAGVVVGVEPNEKPLEVAGAGVAAGVEPNEKPLEVAGAGVAAGVEPNEKPVEVAGAVVAAPPPNEKPAVVGAVDTAGVVAAPPNEKPVEAPMVHMSA